MLENSNWFYKNSKQRITQLWFCLFLCFCLTNPNLYSQSKKPKIALVLSGGGAKGIAHIPVLQALDSLGIVPDLIIGTSMGSIVGGLYAMGYSGDSIAQIAKNTHWDELLGGTVSLNNVSAEEMGEFNKYLIDIDIKDYKPRIKSSLINDQNLREFLSVLTYPSFQTTKFDQLPIPYRAIATDIVNGQLVVMDEGSLSLAMRASMSIPGVFKPVPYQNTLLVDGGLLNNFPTDIAKKMGADFIIGSDVGDEKVTKEQLENLSTLIFQSTMLISNLKNEENKKACDILLNHFPNLTYSTADFNASTTLYNEGKIATKQNLPALIELAKKLKPYPSKKIELLQIDKQFVLDTIVYNNFSPSNLKLVTKRTGIQTGQNYTISNIVEGVRKAIGTNLFNQINSNIYTKDKRTFLELNAFENYRSQLKGSLHFDSFRGFGAILNYTGRNLLGESSRLLITTDIAQQPRFRAQYQKIFGQDKNWWWRTENYNHRLIQNVFIEGKIADNIQYNAIHFDNQINRNINSLKSYLGLGINYHFTHLRPKTDPTFNTVFTLRSYYLNQTEFNLHYHYNTIDKVYFASKGSNLYIELSKSLFQKADINFINSSRENFSGSLNGFTKFNFNYEYRKPISDKVLIIQANTGLLFEDKRKSNQLAVSEYGYASKYFLGGYTTNPLKNGISFPGIKENELNVSQFIHLNLSLQSNLSQKIYLIPHLDLASVGFSDSKEFGKNFLSPKGNWQSKENTSFLASAGATVSYNSFLGPISFDASWVNNNKLSLFISIGLLFNPS